MSSFAGRVFAAAALAYAVLGICLDTSAGTLTRADLARRFAPPLQVGERATDVPAWPIFSELSPDGGPVGYVFESIDLAPIPGFEGTPIDLLIAIDRKGAFLDVEVLHQHEPVFLSGLGEQPLREFVEQYRGKRLTQDITVSSVYGTRHEAQTGNRVVLDGVTKATASVRIVNQSVLTSALAVARAKLGFAPPGAHGPAATVRQNVYQALSFEALLAGGYVGRLHASNADVERLFANGAGAGLDAEALAHPDATFIDLYVAYLNAPTIGRAILGDTRYANLMRWIEPGQQVWWVASAGRNAFVDADFVRASSPARLALRQGGAPFELRDKDQDLTPPAGAPALNAALVLATAPMSGLDSARETSFELDLVRERGSILPERIHRSLKLAYAPPAALFEYPPTPLPDWLIAWRDRAGELAAIGVALALLSVVLVRPRWIARDPRRLRVFRLAFLAFTLGFIGWYAQGQLSIVQVTGAVKSLRAGQGLASFLYDPVSLLLIGYTLASFVAWGRGTFCGWLCPFGALQEFVGEVGKRVGIRRRRLPARLARVLDRGRYALLALLVGAAAFAPATAERLVEVEPFKTAITVGFDRAWPYLAYAVGLLTLGLVYYKFFCRFVCPLGAALTLGGKLRRWNWLVRRAECGQPCQTCRYRCEYEAITPEGAVRYDDCFQCLDCVGIYHDENRCAPILLMRKKNDSAPAAS